MISIDIPTETISKDAIKAERISEIIFMVVLLVILAGGYGATIYFEWKKWIAWILVGVMGLTVLEAIWSVVIAPKLMQRHWRYGISEEFILLHHGALKRVDQLIPMTKVQSVELEQGPIQRKYHLHSITVRTMSTSHTIPSIHEEEARRLRDEIAQFAKLKEVDE